MTATPSSVFHGRLPGALLKATPFLCAILLAACNSTQIVPAGPNTYSVSTSHKGFDKTAAHTRGAAYAAADKFCREQGLVMVPVSIESTGGGVGVDAAIELVFRALPPGDPEIKRPALDKPDFTQRIQYR